MASTNFQPDWAYPPGQTISELLDYRGWTQSEFAENLDESLSKVSNLISGQEEITSSLARKLSLVFGSTEDFWISREKQYRSSLVHLEKNIKWLKKFPIRHMQDQGLIPRKRSDFEKISACLEYFGVPSVSDWNDTYEGSHRLAAYRKSPTFESDEAATIVWLRQGEVFASKNQTEIWDAKKFMAALPEIRELTLIKSPKDFIPKLMELCASCGVSVVISPTPPKCRASGVSRFLSKQKAQIMLSVRYLSDDHFWFTFFHEAAHLLLHSESPIFIEGLDVNSDQEEGEANEYAAETLIPIEFREELRQLPINYRSVIKFSKKVGISPGIVVGQMQHLGTCPRNRLNKLKVRYSWS